MMQTALTRYDMLVTAKGLPAHQYTNVGELD